MRLSIPLLLITACVSAQAQSKTSAVPKRALIAEREIPITVDGKPFATFHYGVDVNKPYLAPLRSASGKVITRGFTMETIEGESKDHLHHTGMWFTYDDVNGVKFWENHPTYTKGVIGKVI